MPVPALPLPRLLAAALLALTSLGVAPASVPASLSADLLADLHGRHAAVPAGPGGPGFGAPFLVRDLTPTATPIGSFPSYFVLQAPALYFTADTPAQGRELYRAEAGGVSLVRDLYPGSEDGTGGFLVSYNGQVYFDGETAETGTELWTSDGTFTGTVLVKDVFTGTRDSLPENFVTYNGLLYFTADDDVHGEEWWHTDGTPGNTSLLADIRPGHLDSSIGDPFVYDGRLFFRATNLHGSELWVTDGTLSGTVEFKDLYPGVTGLSQNSGAPSTYAESGGLLFFAAHGPGTGHELWVSDGTVTGTVPVRDIYVGTTSSTPLEMTPKGGGPLVLFSAMDPAAGRELWRSDGTVTGTVRVADIYTGPIGSDPTDLTLLAGNLYFAADDGVHGKELWRSDGVSATTLITDINPSGSANVEDLFTNGGNLYFAADDGVHGIELWRYDGATTTRLTDLNPGAANAIPGDFMGLGPGSFTFAADNGVNGKEFWRYTAATTTTTLLKNIAPDVGSSQIVELAGAGADRAYFSLDDDAEPYTSNATFTGTVRLGDLVAGPYPDDSYPDQFTGLGDGRAVFQAYTLALGSELWSTDGTPGGTLPLRDIYTGTAGSDPQSLTAIGGQVLFAADDGVLGRELWRTDGTPGGTLLVRDIYTGTGHSYQDQQARLANRLIFNADDGVHGYELWVSDGTLAGTNLVADLNPSGDNYPERMVSTGSQVFFIGSDQDFNTRLWVTDGFTATAVFDPSLIDINVPEQLAAGVHGAFLSAPVGGDLFQLLWTNGYTVTQITNRPAGAGFVGIDDGVTIGDRLFYTDCDLTEGCELWVATPTGASRVRDIFPGLTSSSPENLVRSGRYVVFTASSPTGGRELWYSDGTEAGTQPLAEAAPGAADANPTDLVVSGRYLFFTAYTTANGSELWAMRLPPDLLYVPIVTR